MWNLILLIFGGLFVGALIFTGLRQRIAGADVKGRTPISLPLFMAGKAAMGLLWAAALWRAAAGITDPSKPSSWMEAAGSILFAVGCAIALAAFAALGREIRFGLPGGRCRLKADGLYAWCRHPIYTGFHLMAAGACLFTFNAASLMLLFVAVWVHHRVALAEERFMARHFGAVWYEYADRVGRYGTLPGLKGVRRKNGVSDAP